jgi:hypothetical protein
MQQFSAKRKAAARQRLSVDYMRTPMDKNATVLCKNKAAARERQSVDYMITS